jgi:hypothetical protein
MADKQWGYSIGGHITITERVLKVDHVGRHDVIVISEISAVERQVVVPFWKSNLIISHRGGQLKIANVTTKAAKEIVAALGF